MESTRAASIVLRALRSPWMVVVVGIWVQCFTGASYDFSIYSQSLKENLGLTQQALDSVSVAKDIGANVGIISGLIYDHFPTWIVLTAAALLSFIGNLMMWLSVTYQVPQPPLWLTCIYAFLTGNAQTFSNTAIVVTSVKIFPNTRGTVVGVMKGCLGIGGAILVQLYAALFGNEQEMFLLLMACLTPAVCILATFFVRSMPPVVGSDQTKWLDLCSAIISGLSGYLLVVIILESSLNFGKLWKIVVVCGIVLFLFAPMWVVFNAEVVTYPSVKDVEEGEENLLISEGGPKEKEEEGEEYLLLLGEQQQESKVEGTGGESSSHMASSNRVKLTHPECGHDMTLWQAMLTLDFWLLFVASACGMGSGLTTINNMSQLGLALGYTTFQISILVSLWSIWNFWGRFGAGYISDQYLLSKAVPRPTFIVITLAAMVLGHLIIAFAIPGALYIGPILVGACYGAQWSLMPTTASELFGLKSFGAIFNTIAVASPISSFVLSVVVTGYLYDLEAKKEGQSWQAGSSSCKGAHCFRLSFLIMAGVCLVGSCTTVLLCIRTRNFYSGLRQRMAS